MTVRGDETFLSTWKLALEMLCHLAGSSGAIASSRRRAGAVHKTTGLYTTGEKPVTNVFASWLHSDLRSPLLISATESSQRRTCTKHEVMASARSQSIQGVGPLGVCAAPLTGNAVSHSLFALSTVSSQP